MRILLSFLISLFFSGITWAASTSQQDIVKASLISQTTAVIPGQKLHVGVLLEPKEGWHTYWENPGDAGMATHLEWTLPPGFTAGAIDWPAPERLPEGPLVTFAYPGPVLLPVDITVPAPLDNTTSYPIKVKADWLVCKDICIPESAELELSLPWAGTAAPSKDAGLFEEHYKQHPQVLSLTKPVGLGIRPLLYIVSGNTLTLSLLPLKLNNIHSAFFFPRQENIFAYAAEQKLSPDGSYLTLQITSAPVDKISGILSVTAEDKTTYYDVTLAADTHAPAAIPSQSDTASFPLLILFSLLGGLILNLMPCVLPVLSLKALAVVQKAGHDHKAVVKQGVAYTLGILVSFAVIATLLLSLRQAGDAIGWGFQMQSPPFVGFLVYLLFLVGLSLSGLFHLPVILGSAQIGNNDSTKGSFFTGVLATAVATPCTAPFMASAVGAALTLPFIESLFIFEALGFGLALPFLLISLFPPLRRFLPKPGAWMDTFKQLLAFPMYASVIWLLWVLTLQTGPGGMVVALSGLLAVLFVIWLKPNRWIALAAYALILCLSLPALGRMELDPAMPAMEKTKKMGFDTVEFSKEKLAELRNAHKPVFVDATAAWCITCQVNARVAIHTEAAMEAFKQHGVTLMIADWTRRNADITDFLSSFGYKGVPLYVFYPAEGEPVVLPQLLTPEIVVNTVSK